MREFADDPPVEQTVAERLREADQTVAVAEGVTGGLVCALLTARPGASDYVDRGFVPYAYDALRHELGVPRELLDRHGAVSEPVARELARRARDRADAAWGLSTVGIAGPGGESEETPVGTVFCGLAYAAPWGTGDSWARVERHALDGDRAAVRERGARSALDDLAAALGRKV